LRFELRKHTGLLGRPLLQRQNPPVQRCIERSSRLFPPHYHQLIASRRPNRECRRGHLWVQRSGLTATSVNHERGCPNDSCSACPVGHPSSVGRKAWISPPRRKQNGVASQRGHDIDATTALLRPESHARSVRRKRRIAFVSGVVGQPYRI